MTSYYVVRHGDGWAVKRRGIERALRATRTQAEAILFARETAKNNQPSQVLVQGADGQFRAEWTYGRDPYPPAG